MDATQTLHSKSVMIGSGSSLFHMRIRLRFPTTSARNTRDSRETTTPRIDDAQLTDHLRSGWPVWRIAEQYGMTVHEVRTAIGAAVTRGAGRGAIFGKGR